MRNLESTFEVKDVKIRSDINVTDTNELIDPTRRISLGGKKLFMTKENGIERATNFSAGYSLKIFFIIILIKVKNNYILHQATINL